MQTQLQTERSKDQAVYIAHPNDTTDTHMCVHAFITHFVVKSAVLPLQKLLYRSSSLE